MTPSEDSSGRLVVKDERPPIVIFFGLLFASGCLGSGALHPQSFGDAVGLIAALVGVGFGLALLVFGRTRLTLDREAGVAEELTGLLWGEQVFLRLSGSSTPLEAMERVVIDGEVRRSTRRNSQGTTSTSVYSAYPVRLLGPQLKLTLAHNARAPGAARPLAERVAKYLQLPLEDRSGERVVRRELHELDLSLRERRRREEAAAEAGLRRHAPDKQPAPRQPQEPAQRGERTAGGLPAPPAHARCQLEEGKHRVVVRMPRRGLTGWGAVQGLFGLAFAAPSAWLVHAMVSEGYRPEWLPILLFGGIVALMMLIPSFAILRGLLRDASSFLSVCVGSDELVYEHGTWSSRERYALHVEEIEEIEVTATPARPNSPYLVIRSDALQLVVGSNLGLHRTELEWMRRLLSELVSR